MKHLFRLGAVAALFLSACSTTSTNEGMQALKAQGASPVMASDIIPLLSGHTIYARYDIDGKALQDGSQWVEYYRPDGRYYYKDQRRSFVGGWGVNGGKLCFSEKRAVACGTVYRVGETLYFTQDVPGIDQGTVVGSSVRIEQGDVEKLTRRAGKS
jgi:hypothetical protein